MPNPEDASIGANVASLRQGRSQVAIATAMRGRGFAWSQATMWSLEKGERPLRLTEAVALADVLGVDVGTLSAQPAEVDPETQRLLGELADYKADVLSALMNRDDDMLHTAAAKVTHLIDALRERRNG